jgi:hypothetical protein
MLDIGSTPVSRVASSVINDKIALGEKQSIQNTGGYVNMPREEL